jgi:hypothetical protein
MYMFLSFHDFEFCNSQSYASPHRDVNTSIPWIRLGKVLLKTLRKGLNLRTDLSIWTKRSAEIGHNLELVYKNDNI